MIEDNDKLHDEAEDIRRETAEAAPELRAPRRLVRARPARWA